MGVVVTVTYAQWIALYPQFTTTVTQPIFDGNLWPLAQQFSANDTSGPVCNSAIQTQLLNLMLAHLATLFYGTATAPPSPLVGRVDSVTEGSVSIHAELPESLSAAWFSQTPFGLAWWQLALPFRLARYYPKITPQYQPLGGPRPGGGYGFGYGPGRGFRG